MNPHHIEGLVNAARRALEFLTKEVGANDLAPRLQVIIRLSNALRIFGRETGDKTSRRHKAEAGQCYYCDCERKAGNDHHPSHDASSDCESGKHPHCSCDICF